MGLQERHFPEFRFSSTEDDMGTYQRGRDTGLRAHEDRHDRVNELRTGDWISILALAAVNGLEDVFRRLHRGV